MTKRRTVRKKALAGPAKPGLEKEILKILGVSDRASLRKETLDGSSRAKLLSASRLLDLRGISRLRKDELADRLWRVLQPTESPKVPITVAPTAVEHAARSRAEFDAHKYSLTDREPSSADSREISPPKYIPWSYGQDRVRALAVDPERLYVYWEVTDEARERSRGGLGPGGATAWLNLRVYDTTGRLFDGTNAHSYFDHRIENGSRQWFFDMGKPGSEAFVEIGMKSHEGYFVRIARSGRVIFPRRSPAPRREAQWLTVRSGWEAPVVAERAAAGQAFEPAAQRSVTFPPVPQPVETDTPSARVELREVRDVETRWEAPVSTRVWEAGPFAFPVSVPEPVWETYAGEVSTFEVDGRTHVVFGPWQVVVHGLGAFEERRILSRWVVYRSRAVEEGSESPLAGVGERMLGSSALFGASERRLRGASEYRLGGASELLYRGASERRFGGASERIYRAASERLLQGGSERRYVAASEKLLRGGSERRLGGASGRS